MKKFGGSVCEVYVRGNEEAGCNYGDETIFFRNNTIYSYGTHFPMAIRKYSSVMGRTWYLVNGDDYGTNTTRKHQSKLRQALYGERTATIPFSALESAGIDFDTIELIDQTGDKTWQEPADNEQGYIERHLLGGNLFRATRKWSEKIKTGEGYYDYEYKYHEEAGLFISGIDDTARVAKFGYFLTQIDESVVSHPIITVEQAYDALKPEEVIMAERNGIEVSRQGEFFFVKCSPEVNEYWEKTEKHEAKMIKKATEENPYLSMILKNALLPNRDAERVQRHMATRVVVDHDAILAKGQVKHTGKEHKVVKLDSWHYVYENVQVQSWSASGSVD